MQLLSDNDRRIVRERLAEMDRPVQLTLFVSELDDPQGFSRETHKLLEELVPLSDKLSLEVLNLHADREKAAALGIERAPGLVVAGESDHGIRFLGIPAGYEFAALLEAILDASRGRTELAGSTVEQLRSLAHPVHIQVFSTPTWPYCPAAVRLAHQMAVESRYITAVAIEATEYPDLVQRYGVRGVPRTVINESVVLEGAVPEEEFLRGVLAAPPPSLQ